MTLIQLKHVKIPLGNRQSDAIIASSDSRFHYAGGDRPGPKLFKIDNYLLAVTGEIVYRKLVEAYMMQVPFGSSSASYDLCYVAEGIRRHLMGTPYKSSIYIAGPGESQDLDIAALYPGTMKPTQRIADDLIVKGSGSAHAKKLESIPGTACEPNDMLGKVAEAFLEMYCNLVRAARSDPYVDSNREWAILFADGEKTNGCILYPPAYPVPIGAGAQTMKSLHSKFETQFDHIRNIRNELEIMLSDSYFKDEIPAKMLDYNSDMANLKACVGELIELAYSNSPMG